MEKQKRKASNKILSGGFLLFAALLLSVSSALAVTYSELWTEWGYNNAGTQNRLDDSLVFGTVTNLTSYSQTSYGTLYQPLVNDLDFDGNLDIVVQSGSFLLVYNRTWGLKAQHTVSLTGQPTLTEVSDLDNDGFTSFESYILAHNETVVWIYDFNGSLLDEIYELNVSDDENISLGNNGFKCFYESVVLSSEVCISKYLRYNGTDLGKQVTGGYMSIVIPDTCHNTSCFTVTYWDFFDLNHTLATIPNFYNIDDDGAREVIFWSDFDGDASYGFSVFHTTAQSRFLFVDNLTESEDPTDAYAFNNPIMYNLDAGLGEVFFTNSNDAIGVDSLLYCYDTVGAACAGFPITVADVADYGSNNYFGHSNPVIAEVDGETGICVFGHVRTSGSEGEGQDEARIACYEGDGTIINQAYCSNVWGIGGIGNSCRTKEGWGTPADRRMTSADFNNNGNDDFLINSWFGSSNERNGIIDISLNPNETLIPLWNVTLKNGLWLIPVDLDEDSYLDIILHNGSEEYTYLSAGANTDATIGEISSDTGSPSCIGETVVFTVTDYTDTELNAIKFRIDCYGNGTYTDWSSSSYAPSAQCNFTRYGTFDIAFSITDSAHDPEETDNLMCDWIIDSANCFESGSGGGLTCQAAANATGFSEYHINVSAVEELTGGGTDLDGYAGMVFDWEGSGCNNWTFARGVCPIYKWGMQGLEDLWDWIFWYFWAFLTLILIIVISAFFWKHPEAAERIRERFR